MNEKIAIIDVYELLKDKTPISEDAGSILFNEIKKVLESDKKAIIDFSEIENFTTAFINNSISEFVRLEGINSVIKKLRVRGIDNSHLIDIINLSLSLAQSKYNASKAKKQDEFTD